MRNLLKLFILTLCVVTSTACLKDSNSTIMLPSNKRLVGSIPSDDSATPNPDIPSENTDIPNIQYTTEQEEGQLIIRIDMTGIRIPGTTNDYIRLVGTDGASDGTQNIWVSVDGYPKGIIVYNSADNPDNNLNIKNDFVFLVDNSGSMDDEADTIARDIVDWARKLNSQLDVKFGCVGYDGKITGAIDMTSYEALSSYLNSSTGTNRTKGFGGSNSSYLSGYSSSYSTSNYQDECGMGALHFANDLFTFRKGANRIYVNFTDEPNYPEQGSYFTKYSVHYLDPSKNYWDPSLGTIHTIFSGSTSWTETIYVDERPWRMSEYTGGTIMYTNSSFTGVSLDNLPVTQAMKNSYVIKFTNIDKMMDGKVHTVKITIKSPDGKVCAEATFSIVFKALE